MQWTWYITPLDDDEYIVQLDVFKGLVLYSDIDQRSSQFVHPFCYRQTVTAALGQATRTYANC